MATEFNDSSEATGFVYTIQSMLEDGRLKDWAKATDENFTLSSEAQEKLAQATKAFNEFVEILESCE